MASKLLSSITGSSGTPSLAPDLTFLSGVGTSGNLQVTGLDPSVGLITALSLTGKYVISSMNFTLLTVENITIKLTIDGVVIYDDTFLSPSTNVRVLKDEDLYLVKSSLLLEIQTATDTSVALNYLARKIL